jgi:hypothetical protein
VFRGVVDVGLREQIQVQCQLGWSTLVYASVISKDLQTDSSYVSRLGANKTTGILSWHTELL